ncbi:MAG: cache domain-containing protein [candidate division KSB1 bacterium]|nr:cache domain-containing protein [candidate division KSB1 bacterium]
MLFAKSILVILLALIFSWQCAQNQAKDTPQHDFCQLDEIGSKINQDFFQIRKMVEFYSHYIQGIYEHQKQLKNGLTRSKYAMHDKTVLYKPQDDGGSALFVSGAVPVNPKIRERARFTEFFDLFMKPVVEIYPEVSQIYFNDPESFCRIYPYFDVLMVFEPRLDVRQFNFFYLADEQHNPERKSLWINKPYVDPAGRGWTVSTIAPVYVKDRFVGVAGIDVTIKNIADRYLESADGIFMIVDHEGLVIATGEKGAKIMRLPPLVNHKYIATIRSDTFRSEQFNLLKSPNREIREAAEAIINQERREIMLSVAGETFSVMSAKIDELGWTLWQIQDP